VIDVDVAFLRGSDEAAPGRLIVATGGTLPASFSPMSDLAGDVRMQSGRELLAVR
jgi:hypothetical protein